MEPVRPGRCSDVMHISARLPGPAVAATLIALAGSPATTIAHSGGTQVPSPRAVHAHALHATLVARTAQDT
jgi:hypothetical protein